ncbi:MAG: hypothetical protein AMXMBFR47_25790 [Planctomycetota bacterium]
MPELDGREPIADDEFLYRRIPAWTNWYDPTRLLPLSDTAFRPNDHDGLGISLWRAKYRSIEEAARGSVPGKSYYVAILCARDLRAAGIRVEPDVDPTDPARPPGHATLPDLRAADRKTVQVRQWMRLLAVELVLSVEGPFSTPD